MNAITTLTTKALAIIVGLVNISDNAIAVKTDKGEWRREAVTDDAWTELVPA